MEWGFCNYVGYNFGTENFYLCKMNVDLNLPTPSAFATAFAVLKYGMQCSHLLAVLLIRFQEGYLVSVACERIMLQLHYMNSASDVL